MTTFKDIQNSIIAPLFPLIFSDCNSDKKFISHDGFTNFVYFLLKMIKPMNTIYIFILFSSS